MVDEDKIKEPPLFERVSDYWRYKCLACGKKNKSVYWAARHNKNKHYSRAKFTGINIKCRKF